MANNLRSVTYSGETNYSVADSDVTVYTVPAGVTSILLGLTVSNVLNELITVSIKIKDDDVGQTEKYLHKVPINQGASLESFSTKLILNENDELILSSSSGNSFDVIASLVETS